MNWPENRYDSDGWRCQWVSSETSRSGRRSSGDSAGVRPPMVMWLPPPVPRWLPSTAKVSVPSRLCRACSYSVVVTATCSSQLASGWMFTSMTPGSGVTDRVCSRGSFGGP